MPGTRAAARIAQSDRPGRRRPDRARRVAAGGDLPSRRRPRAFPGRDARHWPSRIPRTSPSMPRPARSYSSPGESAALDVTVTRNPRYRAGGQPGRRLATPGWHPRQPITPRREGQGGRQQDAARPQGNQGARSSSRPPRAPRRAKKSPSPSWGTSPSTSWSRPPIAASRSW